MVVLLVLFPARLGGATSDQDARRSGPQALPPAVTGIEDLMHALARSGGVRARFREVRYVSLLTDPLESEGMLYFAPPDLLARHTTRPGRASVVVRGSRVQLGDETGTQDVPLGSSELAAALVDNLVGLLRGDLPALRARHDVRFRLRAEGWELRLEPRSPLVRTLIDSIRLEGHGDQLDAMEVVETNGDRTVTVFSEVQTGRAFTPSELEHLFRLDGAERAP